jgi:hypothetical protein
MAALVVGGLGLPAVFPGASELVFVLLPWVLAWWGLSRLRPPARWAVSLSAPAVGEALWHLSLGGYMRQTKPLAPALFLVAAGLAAGLGAIAASLDEAGRRP